MKKMQVICISEIIKKLSVIVVVAAFVIFPVKTEAVNPFGGAIGSIIFCQFDGVIWVDIGPPRGGPHVWVRETKTYNYGPPAHSGQWLLGLRAGAMHICVITVSPSLQLTSGMMMLMEGSSE